jgi:microcystin-dependent protein
MSDQFIGELRCFPFNFAPTQWAQAQGQIIAIQANTALFAVLGTYYGGNGTSNFALPDLQGNLVVCQGQGPGLSEYVIGEQGGSASITLLTGEMPAHNHRVLADAVNADVTTPIAGALARPKAGTSPGNFTNSAASAGVQLSPLTITPTSGGQPHDNVMPYLAMNWCIALQGIYPARG